MRTRTLLLLSLCMPLPLGAEPLHERVVHTSKGESQGPPPNRHTMVQADRETGPEPPGERNYEEVFEPSLFPYKRMSAFDMALPDESLTVKDRSLTPATPARPFTDLPRTTFRGSLAIDLVPDRWIAIPSVGAGARLLSFTIEPKVPLEFAHDGAENWFVRSSARGRHQLALTTDAPTFYFSGDIPNARLSDEPRARLPAVPPKIRALGREVLGHLGLAVQAQDRLRPLLSTLVTYFRSFEVGDASPPSGSTYRDLAIGKHGACRHRAFAFVITALVAGIPARYVENELHVFVEVYVPAHGWRRIDLGGAPIDLARAARDRRGEPHPGERESRLGDGRRGEDSRQIPTLRVQLGSATGYRGERVELSGSIAEPLCGELPVEVFLEGPSGGIRLGATTAREGRFHLAAAVPRDVALGDHKVIARTVGDAHCAPASSRNAPPAPSL